MLSSFIAMGAERRLQSSARSSMTLRGSFCSSSMTSSKRYWLRLMSPRGWSDLVCRRRSPTPLVLHSFANFKSTVPALIFMFSRTSAVTWPEWVEAGRIDLAVLYEEQRSQNVRVSPIMTEYLFLIGPRGERSVTPLSLSEVSSRPLVLPGKD